MRTTLKVLKYELEDVRRSRGVLAYSLVLLAVSEGLLRFGGSGPKAMLSLLSVVLLLVPLVSLVFGTMYLYNARDFTELLLAQPVRRGALFRGLYLGLSLPLAAGLVLGVVGLTLLKRDRSSPVEADEAEADATDADADAATMEEG